MDVVYCCPFDKASITVDESKNNFMIECIDAQGPKFRGWEGVEVLLFPIGGLPAALRTLGQWIRVLLVAINVNIPRF